MKRNSIQQTQDQVPEHQKIKSNKQSENSSTVGHQRLEGEGELFPLDQNLLTAEDESHPGEIVSVHLRCPA